jgi:hypothetical protein
MTAVGVYENWDTISGLFDRHVESPTQPIYGYYVQNVFAMKNNAGTFTTRERAMWGTHYINTTGGDLDTTWTTADFVSVESAVATFWGAIATQASSDCALVEHRWYPFGPGTLPPNPPIRVNTLGSPSAGSGAPTGPHQVARTVTLRTPLRRHWGRIYTPSFTSGTLTGGQLATAAVDTLANAAKTMFTSPQTSNGITPVVWDRNRRVALGITAIEADSVPDIIRRRRPRDTAYKAVLTS